MSDELRFDAEAVEHLRRAAAMVFRMRESQELDGTEPCPVAGCSGEVRWSKATANGDINVDCSNPGCPSSMVRRR